MSGSPPWSGCARAQAPNPRGVASYLVVDFHSHKILSAFNPDASRQVASLTKIATAIVVFDWSERSGISLDTLATVPQSAATIGGANPLGMMPGDRITLRDALYSALIGSDNLAAQTLAHFVGRDLLQRRREAGDPVAHFVRHMNALAELKGLENTWFTNPHGMDHVGKPPYSTAADVARLAIVAMARDPFRFMVSQPQRRIGYLRGPEKRAFIVKNTNELLSDRRIDGIKTGLTSRAGPCVVVSGSRSSLVEDLPDGRKRVTPRRLIVVVLGAPNRFQVAEALLEEGWGRFDAWVRAGRPVTTQEEVLNLF